MTNDAKRTLLDKWRLVRAAARDNKRLSSGDVAVLIALCDRYGSKRRQDEPPKAGHALLGVMSGMSRRATIDSTRRLIAAGYISVRELGAGTRGTKYDLNFARGEVDITTKSAEPSGEVDFTTVVNCTSPLTTASGEAYFTESPLTEAPLQGALTERETDCGLATPGAAGLAPASPAAPQEELQQPSFESLWRAYAYNRGKKEARAVWNALPVEVDRAAVIRAASEWQASWAAQGKPDAPRFTLARWLKDERFDEDAPRGFQKVVRPAKTKQKPASPAKPAPPVTARITATDVVELGFGSSELRFTTTDEAGTESSHVIILEHPDADTQFAGQRQLAALVHAAGLPSVEDGSDLLGRTIKLVGGEERFAAPDSRPDDDPPPPVRPEPVRYANPDPQPAPTPLPPAPSDWPEWMDAEYEDDDAA